MRQNSSFLMSPSAVLPDFSQSGFRHHGPLRRAIFYGPAWVGRLFHRDWPHARMTLVALPVDVDSGLTLPPIDGRPVEAEVAVFGLLCCLLAVRSATKKPETCVSG